jgi:hypothetical protein
MTNPFIGQPAQLSAKNIPGKKTFRLMTDSLLKRYYKRIAVALKRLL